MSTLKLNENQHLGKQELNRWDQFHTTDGYKLLLKQMTSSYGVVHLPSDVSFDNLRVVQGTTPDKITILAGYAIDKNFDLITVPTDQVDVLTSPTDSADRKVIISWGGRKEETGTVGIAVDGTLTGTLTEFTKVLRGAPNHAIKIRFPESALNTQEYQVLTVSSDTSAVIQGASFTAEAGQSYIVIGTFTPGIAVPPANKEIYTYDHFQARLELAGYTPIPGLEFSLATINTDGVAMTITDTRQDFTYDTNHIGSADELTETNPLAGVELIKFDSTRSARDYNILRFGWGFRALDAGWNAFPSLDKVVVSVGAGGIKTSIATLSTGIFDGWRLYFGNGKYAKIVSSTIVGPDLEVIIEDYNTVIYPIDGDIAIVPDADFIHVIVTTASDTVPSNNVEQLYPIERGYADVRVKAAYLGMLQYRMERNGQYTDLLLPNNGNYLNENSFNDNGVQTSSVFSAVAAGVFVPQIHVADEFYTFKAWTNRDNEFNGNNLFQGDVNIGPSAGRFLAQGTVRWVPVIEDPPSIPGSGIYSGFANKNHVRFVSAGGTLIRGFAGGESGKMIIVESSTNSLGNLTINHDDGPDATARVYNPGGASLEVLPGQCAVYLYDETILKWVFAWGSVSQNQVLELLSPWVAFVPTFLLWGTGLGGLTTGTNSGYYKIAGKTLHLRILHRQDKTGGSPGVSQIDFNLPGGVSPIMIGQGESYHPVMVYAKVAGSPSGAGFRSAFCTPITGNKIRVNTAAQADIYFEPNEADDAIIFNINVTIPLL